MNSPRLSPHSEWMATLSNSNGKRATIIGTRAIRESMDTVCLEQALNALSAPGVSDLIINPDAHQGYGVPIGSVLVSPTHIYPGPVGVDVKCSMSLLQLNLPEESLQEKTLQRSIIKALTDRIPTGPGQGQRSVKKSRHLPNDILIKAVIEGASVDICNKIGIPAEWICRCEDAYHRGHDNTIDSLNQRFDYLKKSAVFQNLDDKLMQLGSYGGGNHFGECEVVHIVDSKLNRETADAFGLIDGKIAFLSHCGSRGFGNVIATNQFKLMKNHFEKKKISFPANDSHLVYAELGSKEADAYLDDMALAANFATVNHLLINALVLEAFQEVIPGTKGTLVYLISHNIARKEHFNNRDVWVHRKGATRAFPAYHISLSNSPFYKTGHPILLPGNPVSGSLVMVAEAGAHKSCFSINHGAGRKMSRKAAIRQLDQTSVHKEFNEANILTNCRIYPKDEAPAAYKDFNEVVRSVTLAGLARTVAQLKTKLVIKDSSKADD